MKRINDGEEVGITAVQIAEIANLLENYLPLNEALKIEEFLLLAENVKVSNVTKKDCLRALEIAKEKEVGLSDAIAYIIMKKVDAEGIYSFDRILIEQTSEGLRSDGCEDIYHRRKRFAC